MNKELLAAEQSFATIYRTVGALENCLCLAAVLLVAKNLQHPENQNQQQKLDQQIYNLHRTSKPRTSCRSLKSQHKRNQNPLDETATDRPALQHLGLRSMPLLGAASRNLMRSRPDLPRGRGKFDWWSV